MRADGLSPNEITFNSLLNKASNYEQGREVLELMREQDVKINAVIYGTLIKKAPVNDGLKLLERMLSDKIRPNTYIFNSLLQSVTNEKLQLSILLDLLEKMLDLEIAPDVGQNNKRPFTVNAVRGKVKRSLKPFQAWTYRQQSKVEALPLDVREAWEMFFRAF